MAARKIPVLVVSGSIPLSFTARGAGGNNASRCLLLYFSISRSGSSVGQSIVLIMRRSRVRFPPRISWHGSPLSSVPHTIASLVSYSG